MDVLVVVGNAPPPERLAARAAHVLRVDAPDLTPQTISALRNRIPRDIGVVGDGGQA
ncbi:MAG: hypothetical protein JO087_20275, partial [Actinobacteria bacterium]|nr:hypothetical protein [Actinomycetota bacterium]